MSNEIKLTNIPSQSNGIKLTNAPFQNVNVSNTNSIAVGATDHSKLSNRDLADQHPISSITGLQEELESLSQVVVFTPIVSSEGVISWTNNGGLKNPTPVNIKGVKGDKGDTGAKGDKGDKGEQGVSGVYVGTGDMPEGYNVQIDSSGTTENYLNETDIIDNLTSTDTDKALSANQGKVLNDNKVDKVEGKGLSSVSDISIMGVGGGVIGPVPPVTPIVDWSRIRITKANGSIENVEFYNKDQMEENLNNKADKATTLEGYGITDAYTKNEVDNALSDKADREEMLEKLCPHGEAESASATVTATDGLGGTVLRDFSITGAEGGVGDLNSETGKYDIPVTISGKNLLDQVFLRNKDNWVRLIRTDGVKYDNGLKLPTKEAGTYILSMDSLKASEVTMYIQICKYNSGGIAAADKLDSVNFIYGKNVSAQSYNVTFTVEDGFDYYLHTNASGYTTYPLWDSANFDNWQLEQGSVVTDYEPYITPQTVNISLDAPLGAGESINREDAGTDIPLIVNGTNIIEVGTAVSPSKVTIDYYKDINTVINNLTNAILSQGGNV